MRFFIQEILFTYNSVQLLTPAHHLLDNNKVLHPATVRNYSVGKRTFNVLKTTVLHSTLCVGFAIALASCGPSFDPTIQDVERDLIGKTAVNSVTADSWTFEANQKFTIKIVDIQKDGKKANVVVEMVTQAPPIIRDGVKKGAGRLRLHYEYGADRWMLMEVESLTFKWSILH